MSNYLIELSVVHLALAVAYWLFLRKEREYALMRFYIIGAVAFSLLVPLFKLPALFTTERAINIASTDVTTFSSVTVVPIDNASFLWTDLLAYLYIGVTLFFFYKFIDSILQVVFLRRKSIHQRSGDLYVYKITTSKASFNFFNWIFLSKDIDDYQEYQVMLEHEKAHASLRHTYDIIFLQLFKALFWWLPTAWLAIKEIKKIHEYQADAYVLKSYSLEQYSSILISSTLRLNGLGLVSSFYDGLILKRLKAMKQKTKKVSPWKLGALSALCAVLFIVLACTEEQKSDIEKSDLKQAEIFVIMEQLPEAKGGMAMFYDQLRNEIDYPAEALKEKIEGKVYVEFLVEKNGSLSDVKAIKGIGGGCDEEAVRAVQNVSAFKPATQQSKPVRVRMVLPIAFEIDKGRSGSGSIQVLDLQPVNASFKVTANYNNGEWAGAVYDETGDGLPGVNIIVEGTTTGTVSGLDGSFKLKAVKADNLYLSFVGYESVRLNTKELSR